MAEDFSPKIFLQTVSKRPGVYQMKNASADIIYVGKAKNLFNRLSSYFQKDIESIKTRVLVSQIADIEIIITGSEVEALLLEQTLIKKLRPRYNVLLRDDKSYPYIFLSTHADHPRFSYYRGERKPKGQYFGPYPNASSVKNTLHFIQKIFKVRQCEDAYFRNRSRPCLQYQIKRCSAPCVGLIEDEDYQRDVELSRYLLEGKNKTVIQQLIDAMTEAATQQNYEHAAQLRDQIADLKRMSEKQYVSGHQGNTDVIACYLKAGQACVQVFFIRNGVNLGGKSFFPAVPDKVTTAETLYGFITQFYLNHEIPAEILISESLEEQNLIEEVLSIRAEKKIKLKHRVRTDRLRWLEMAKENAQISLDARLSSRSGMMKRLDEVRRLLGKDELPERMECFDISHTMGEATVASCVVFNVEGPVKQAYRRFNIENITPGDDYAAMRQAMERRYTRLLKEGLSLPDIIFIDGGKGQLSIAEQVASDLQLTGVTLVGVAKGPARKAGEEVLIISRGESDIRLGNESPALHLIQQIRDEAHRFAIAGHRARRGKARTQSPLEGITGIGAKRRQKLLVHFGGFQQIAKARKEELATVPGISKQLAEIIYDQLHGLNT